MIELFHNESPYQVGVTKPPEWSFIQRGFQKNIDKVVDYYKFATKAVSSSHILVRLLQTLGVPKSLELERYYANVDAIGLTTAMTFKMTSSISKGIFHKGLFYGDDNPEILLATDEYFDFEDVNRNWKNVSAVTPVLHPKSDLDIHLPNGQSYSAEKGLSVIMINVPMLAVQYRAFWNTQQARPDDGANKTIMQFIGGYVIPNMLQQHMELCLFNRLSKKFYKINDGTNVSFRSHPFALANYESHIDLAIDKVIKNIDRSSKRFDVVLKTIPSFCNENIYESLMLPDLAPTSQVVWSLVLARLRVVNFLFDTCEEHLTSRNQSTINQILRAFRMNSVYNTFKTFLPDSVYYEAQEDIDNMMYLIGREDI